MRDRSVDEAPELSIIIVASFGIRELVLQALRSVERNGVDVALEAFVVDNASGDGTVEAIRERHPWVTVLENPVNIGFSPANNQALPLARGRYVLYLNPDTEVGPGTLRACVDALDGDPEVGMVGCRIMFPDGRVQLEGARNPYTVGLLAAESLWLHMFFPRHPYFASQRMGDWDHRGTRDVEAISGAFMMVRRYIAEDLAGLPEEVFLYHEDLSFCLRVRNAGWRIRYLGDVEMVHYTNQSTKRSTARWGLLEGEVKVRLIREHQGRLAAIAARAVLAIRSVLRMGIAAAGVFMPSRIRARYPRVFHLEAHALMLAWCFAPALVRDLMPQPVQNRPPPRVYPGLQPGG